MLKLVFEMLNVYKKCLIFIQKMNNMYEESRHVLKKPTQWTPTKDYAHKKKTNKRYKKKSEVTKKT